MSGCGFTCGDIKVETSPTNGEGEAFEAKYPLIISKLTDLDLKGFIVPEYPKDKKLSFDKTDFIK
jgi:hypothetical protein